MKHLFSVMLAAIIGFMTGCNSTAATDAVKAESAKKVEQLEKAKTAENVKKAVKKTAKKTVKQLTLAEEIKLTTTPVQYKRHAKRHAAKKAYAQANKDKIKILMLGDSITHQWEYKPAAKVQEKYIAPYNVLNLGCGGDRTQNTIWIIEKSGILELIKPQLVTIMIGTNNHRNRPEATVEGVKRIVAGVRKLYPDAKILLYAIFPRGKDNKDPRRMTNEKVNAEIVKLCNGKDIEWVDIRKNFLTPEGVLEKSMMPDLLHPRHAKGYTVWGESLKPYFEKYGK